MSLAISDTSGLLYGYYPASGSGPSDTPVSGSGSHTITFAGSYVDVQDIINTLTYVATANGGSDDIHFDIWNQAGTETTGDIPVSIIAAGTTETWTGAVSTDWNTAGNWSGNTVPTNGDTVVIPPLRPNNATLSNATLTGETINLTDDSTGHVPTIVFNNVTLGAGSELQTPGTYYWPSPGLFIGGSFTIGAGATMAAQGAIGFALLSAGTAVATVVNDGLIQNAVTSTEMSSIGMPLVNNGTIVNAVGGLGLSSIVNNGSVILEGGQLTVSGSISGGTIEFAGPAGLSIGRTAFSNGAAISGFGKGDEIIGPSAGSVTGSALSLSNGTLDITSNGTLVEAIPVVGNLGVGNLQINTQVAGPKGSVGVAVLYAPDGGPSNDGTYSPDISAPATGTVVQGGTLNLGSVSIANAPTLTLDITASNGTLTMNGASGSGTNHLSINTPTPYSQIAADLATLAYTPGTGTTSDTIEITADNPQAFWGATVTSRYIPIAVGSGSSTTSGPTLNEPSSETVATSATQAVGGNYADSFAAGNPGSLYLAITDSSGTLRATNAAGNAVAGSGTNSITLNTDYSDVNALLKSLTYTAGGSAGTDSIHFDIWNQAGVETTGTVPITVNSGGGATTTTTWTGTVSGDWNNAANWSGDAVPTSGTVTIPAGTPNIASLSNGTLSNETIIMAIPAEPNSGPTLDLTGVTLGSGSILETSNPTNSANPAVVYLGGTFTVGAGAKVGNGPNVAPALFASGATASIVNNGTIENTSFGINGGTLTNNGLVLGDAGGGTSVGAGTAFINAGTVLATSKGAIGFGVNDTIVGGTIAIASGGVSMAGTLMNADIQFNGSGVLTLQRPVPFSGSSALLGFGQGDQVNLTGGAVVVGDTISMVNGTLDLGHAGTIDQAIPLNGSYGIGNFEEMAGDGAPSAIVYAPDGGFSGLANPDVSAPAAVSVAQSSTLALNNVAIQNSFTTTTLSISDTSGTLYMSGATGSGTNHLSLTVPTSQANAELASLTYMPGAGASGDIIRVSAGISLPSALEQTTRDIMVSVGTTSAAAGLNEPASETVAPSGTVAIGGSFTDSFAQGNPGQLWLGITDSAGTLTATDAAGNAVAGSGTSSIGVGASYVDVNAILAGLHYTAGPSTGSDTIQFDIWNQAGKESTAATAVTIGASGMMAADFAPQATTASPTVAPNNTSTGSSSMMMDTTNQQPIGVPLTTTH